MKKLITIFLTLFMLLSAAACQPTPEQAVACSLENPGSCEACQ